MHRIPTLRARALDPWYQAMAVGLLAILAGCSTPPPKPAPAVAAPEPAPPPVAVTPPALPEPVLRSQAPTPRDYRRDAAVHLYARNTERIFAGKLPPLLYAVGVLQVDIDRMGYVTDIRWMRAPSHAPEVMAEIERAVRQAAPFPAPTRMGRVTYTDTWLWHKSGRFQLDTLTEGQL
jgi:periplasmic protein TonB